MAIISNFDHFYEVIGHFVSGIASTDHKELQITSDHTSIHASLMMDSNTEKVIEVMRHALPVEVAQFSYRLTQSFPFGTKYSEKNPLEEPPMVSSGSRYSPPYRIIVDINGMEETQAEEIANSISDIFLKRGEHLALDESLPFTARLKELTMRCLYPPLTPQPTSSTSSEDALDNDLEEGGDMGDNTGADVTLFQLRNREVEQRLKGGDMGDDPGEDLTLYQLLKREVEQKVDQSNETLPFR